MGGVSSKRFQTQPRASVLRTERRCNARTRLNAWLSPLCDTKPPSVGGRSCFLTDMSPREQNTEMNPRGGK
jgi:hypothetical protein